MSNHIQQQTISLNATNGAEVRRQIEKFTEREIKWVAHNICSDGLIRQEEIKLNDIKNELISLLPILHNDKLNFNQIQQSKLEFLIPDEHFEWLKNDYRAQLFTCSILINNYKEAERSSFMDIYYGNEPLGFIYSFFDLSMRFISKSTRSFTVSSINNKVELIKIIKNKWFNIVKNNKYDMWVRESEHQRLEYIYKHLKRTSRLILVNSSITIDPNRSMDLILASLDTMGIEQLAIRDYEISQSILDSRNLSINKIKQAWSQKKYHDAGKAKRPYHLPLTKESKERLEKMAMIENKQVANKLNELINLYYETEYINQDGKDIY